MFAEDKGGYGMGSRKGSLKYQLKLCDHYWNNACNIWVFLYVNSFIPSYSLSSNIKYFNTG